MEADGKEEEDTRVGKWSLVTKKLESVGNAGYSRMSGDK